MTKKTASTSNVPQTTNNNQNINNSSNKSSPRKGKKNNSHPVMMVNGNNGSSSGGVLNSKYFHNQSTLKIKPKTKRDEQSISDVNKTTNSNTDVDEESNVLMKKLFEAVQKQKSTTDSRSTGKPRSRKGTAPSVSTVPKPINSSETYAGAAFDRAPAATSFPIPSFAKASVNPNGSSSNFSTSCPLPSGFESKKMPSPSSPSLKTLSISELFKTDPPPQNSEQNKLESLTNDLRKILNLR